MKLYQYAAGLAAAVLMIISCNGGKKPMEPEEVAEAFCRAVSAGDFVTARSLCDSVSMDSYLENCRESMNSMREKDSCAFKIALEMLSGAEFEVEEIQKDGDIRIVRYKFAAEGNSRTRKAGLQKEEGEWRVTSITDAI